MPDRSQDDAARLAFIPLKGPPDDHGLVPGDAVAFRWRQIQLSLEVHL